MESENVHSIKKKIEVRRRSRNESHRHGVIEKVPSWWRLTLLGGDFLVQKKGIFSFFGNFLGFFLYIPLSTDRQVGTSGVFFKLEARLFHFYKVLLDTLEKHTSAPPQLRDKQNSRKLHQFKSSPIPLLRFQK